MNRRVSDEDNKVLLDWVMVERCALPAEPTAEQVKAARRVIAISMAHDKLDELKEYYLDELKSDDADERAQALRDMGDPVDLASYVSEQLEDREEWDIEAEVLMDSILAEFDEVVK